MAMEDHNQSKFHRSCQCYARFVLSFGSITIRKRKRVYKHQKLINSMQIKISAIKVLRKECKHIVKHTRSQQNEVKSPYRLLGRGNSF